MKTKKVLKYIKSKDSTLKNLNIEHKKFKNLEVSNVAIKKSVFFSCLFKKVSINADIENVDFSMCEFKNVKFEGNTDEVFDGTSVSNVHFYGCTFRNVNFDLFDIDDKVSFDDCTGVYLFNRNGGRVCIATEFDDCLMVKAGCFWGTLKEFEEASYNKYVFDGYEEDPYKNQIEYLKSIEKDLYSKSKKEIVLMA